MITDKEIKIVRAEPCENLDDLLTKLFNEVWTSKDVKKVFLLQHNNKEFLIDSSVSINDVLLFAGYKEKIANYKMIAG